MRASRIVAVLVLIVLAGGGYWYFQEYRAAPQETAGGGEAAPAQGGPQAQGGGIPVEVAKVERGRMDSAVLAIGTLRSNQSVVVRPEIAGRIVRIHFAEGQPIDAGKPLISLDDTIARAEVDQARAALALSRANFERASELLGRGAGTRRTRDEALANLRNDEASLALAEARLEKTVINAPFEGIVGLRQADIGDYLAVGQAVVNIEDIDPIKVDFRVPEIFLAAVEIGQRIEVTADPWPGRSFEGELYAINPLIDAQGRSIVIRARIANDDGVLRPGLFVRVRLILEGRADALLVPEQAIVPVGEDRFVYRVTDGKAAFVKVATGERRDGLVEITEGLKAGDTVVTAGQIKLQNGVPVSPVAAQQPQRGEIPRRAAQAAGGAAE